MHHLYILYSENTNKYYACETSDLAQHIAQHNSGFYKGSYTKQAQDWILYYEIICSDIIVARKIESHIKRMKSRKYIEDIKNYQEISRKLLLQYSK